MHTEVITSLDDNDNTSHKVNNTISEVILLHILNSMLGTLASILYISIFGPQIKSSLENSS